METPTQKFDSLLSKSTFLFLVYYRGHWCPFCQSYTKSLAGITSAIEAAGGTPVIVTSESPEHLDGFRTATGYTTGAAIVDTENMLAADLRARGLLDVAISERSGYPHGMAQPAVLVVKRVGGEVLYQWAIVPSMMNLGGAKDRPDLKQVWENVAARLDNKPVVHKEYKRSTFFGVMMKKIFG